MAHASVAAHAATSPGALLAVLTDISLLSHIARFQRGLPQPFIQLRAAFVASLPEATRAFYGPASLWRGVLRDAELRLVQKLFHLRALPESKDNEELNMDDVPARAVEYGRLDVLEWLHGLAHPPRWRGTLLHVAINRSQWSVAQWLLKHHPEACVDELPFCVTKVAAQGQLDLLKNLIAFRPDVLPPVAMDQAARNGHIQVVMYLHEHTNATCTTAAMDGAAVYGQLNVVKYLHENRTEGCTAKALNNAAISGNLELVQFLHEQRSEGCTSNAMDNAAYYGHLDVVRFLHEHRTEGCTTRAMDSAAKNGHLPTVQFLHENRTEGCTDEAIESAASNGHIEVVMFLHEKRQQSVQRSLTLRQAIQLGHVDVVRYLHSAMGLPFDALSLKTATEHGSQEMIKFVADHMPAA
jgi:hypothetical protein